MPDGLAGTAGFFATFFFAVTVNPICACDLGKGEFPSSKGGLFPQGGVNLANETHIATKN
jgi:hypothetical protein